MPRRAQQPTRNINTFQQQLLLAYRFIVLSCFAGLLVWNARMPPSNVVSPVPQPMPLPHFPLAGVTVILDPGHGGTDSGYRRSDCREDVLNYRFAATLERTLTAAGAHVLFTVKSAALTVPLIEGKTEPPLIAPGDARLTFNLQPVYGTVDCLHRRAAAVRLPYLALDSQKRAAMKGLYFLAVHHDAFYRSNVRGGHVLYDKRDGGPPLFAHVLARRLSEAHLARKKYAGQIPTSDARQLGVLNPLYNPVPQRALLEVATLSNPRDRDNALSRQWRWRVAHLITDAIIECER
jgi:N-acetylmuramoyl-L-alanine amidase